MAGGAPNPSGETGNIHAKNEIANHLNLPTPGIRTNAKAFGDTSSPVIDAV